MKVVVREIGYRPPLATPARLNAPQGARALADLMAEETFADLCVINIDWDSIPPAMVIDTVKWFIEYGGQRLEHSWPIEIEDAFGQDNMDNGVLRLIVQQLREHFLEMTEIRRRRDEA